MNVYFVNRYSKIKGPFDVFNNNRKQLLNVGDICLRSCDDGIAFLLLSSSDNTWNSCKQIGLGENNVLTELNNQLLFSFDGLHKRIGNLVLIRKFSAAFKEKVIVDFFQNAIDILAYKRDNWDVSLFSRFLSPKEELTNNVYKENDYNTEQHSSFFDKPKEKNLYINNIDITKERDEYFQKDNNKIIVHKFDDVQQYILSDYDEKESEAMFYRFRRGDKTEYKEIVKKNLNLVYKLARSYKGRGVEYDDLVQEGSIGLLKAIERFNPNRHVPFPLYAKWWILQFITRALLEYQSIVKIPGLQVKYFKKIRSFIEKFEQENGYEPSCLEIDINEEISQEHLDYLSNLPDKLNETTIRTNEWDEFPSSYFINDDSMEEESRAININRAFKILNRREIFILRHYFGIGEESKSLSEIGNNLGLTRERVRQLVEKSVTELRNIIVFHRNNSNDSIKEEINDEKSTDKQQIKEEPKQIIKKKERRENIKAVPKSVHKLQKNTKCHIIKISKYRIQNYSSKCRIFDDEKFLELYNSAGNIIIVGGNLYRVIRTFANLTINRLNIRNNQIFTGETVVLCQNHTELYKIANLKIESIIFNNRLSKYYIIVGGKYYDSKGYSLN